MTADNPAEWLCPVCARIPVRYGTTCAHKTPDAWECENLDNPVNETQTAYYVRLWREKRAGGKSVGIAQISNE